MQETGFGSERELVVRGCFLYLKMNDDETKDEAYFRLLSLIPEEIDYLIDATDLEVREI